MNKQILSLGKVDVETRGNTANKPWERNLNAADCTTINAPPGKYDSQELCVIG